MGKDVNNQPVTTSAQPITTGVYLMKDVNNQPVTTGVHLMKDVNYQPVTPGVHRMGYVNNQPGTNPHLVADHKVEEKSSYQKNIKNGEKNTKKTQQKRKLK